MRLVEYCIVAELKGVKSILKLKEWGMWLFSGICFLFVGVSYVIDKKYYLGGIYTFLSVLYIVISINRYKKNNKANQIQVSDEVLKNMDIELKKLIDEGEKIKAIKKCRIATGFGLKEAKEYVDLLSEQKLK